MYEIFLKGVAIQDVITNESNCMTEESMLQMCQTISLKRVGGEDADLNNSGN